MDPAAAGVIHPHPVMAIISPVASVKGPPLAEAIGIDRPACSLPQNQEGMNQTPAASPLVHRAVSWYEGRELADSL